MPRFTFDNTGTLVITTNTIRHEPSCKQLGVNTNRTSFLCGNRKEHHNTELRTRGTPGVNSGAREW